MIEFLYTEGQKACEKEPLKVRCDGRVCGEIRKEDGGYRYHTKSKSKLCGELFPTLALCQRSLMDPDGE